ncbi:MAG: helix-turn-helix domain-containing protein [Nitrososphaerota archaeon]
MLVLSIKEAAQQLGFSKNFLKRLAEQGVVPSLREGRRLKFLEHQIEEIKNMNITPPKRGRKPAPREGGYVPKTNLSVDD